MRLINQRTTVILLGLGLVFGGAAFAQDVPDQAAQKLRNSALKVATS